jgi:hypothetical protein
MATTRNQDLQASTNQAQDSIQHVTYEIGSTNSHLSQFDTQSQHKFYTMEAKLKNQFNTLHSTVNQLLNFTLGPSSSDQTVTTRFSSPYAILHRGPYSISLCRLIFPINKIQRQKKIIFHMYAYCTLYKMCIRRMLHYIPCTSGFVLENEY